MEDLRFKIVNSTLLAKKWGQVKHSQAMGWNKIKKVKQEKSVIDISQVTATWGKITIIYNYILFFQILDLYLRKNLIKIVSAETLVYQFLIVPKHVKQDLLVTAPAAC